MLRTLYRFVSLGCIIAILVSCANYYLSLHLDAEIASLAWSPDGQVLAIVSGNGTVHFWDSERNDVTPAAHSQAYTTSVSWSPDGARIASDSWSGAEAGSIELWDMRTGEVSQIRTLPAQRTRTLAWSPGGSTISAGMGDGTVLLWDPDADLVRTLESQLGEVLNIAWSPQGDYLAAGLQGGSILIWDAAHDELLHTLTYSTEHYIADLTWSPDGERLAAASCFSGPTLPENCALVVWDPFAGDFVQAMRGGVYDFTSVAWSPNGRWIASALMNGDVVLYNTNSGKRVRTFRTPTGTTIVTWSPDSRLLAAGSEDGSVLIWDMR